MRLRSAASVYRCTSFNVAWPVMEAIWSALHPISASRRAVALRKPCRRYAVASGGVAQFPKPIAKAGRGVGLAEVRDQERLDAHGRRRVDDGAQLGVDWYFEVRFLAALGLALAAWELPP
jgi:hypothetical protein